MFNDITLLARAEMILDLRQLDGKGNGPIVNRMASMTITISISTVEKPTRRLSPAFVL